MNSVAAIGFVLWIIVIAFYSLKGRKIASLWTALVLLVECQGLIMGPVICFSSYLGWPNIDFNEFRWVIGIGGVAITWIALTQVIKEFEAR